MPQVTNEAYLGNPNLKRANTAVKKFNRKFMFTSIRI